MPRYNLIEGKRKIRKRGCSTLSSTSRSSASSTILQSYRFKRALLINKRGGCGSTTPVPRWRITSRSPASIIRMPHSPLAPPPRLPRNQHQPPVSARKLAATLWEMNSTPLKDTCPLVKKRGNNVSKNTQRVAARSLQSGYLPHRFSDPSHSLVSESSGIASHYARTSNLQTARRIRGLDSISNASFMEIEMQSRRLTPTGSVLGVKTHLRDLCNGLTTSKKLLKVLSRVWGTEKHFSSGKPIISALCAELESAGEQVDKLVQEQHLNHKEINYLMKHFAEEKAAWKKKVHGRVENAVKTISNDLEMERKLRKRTESLTKTLGRELADTKAALSSVVQQLKNEKRTREMMEQVGDELARGIGEDRELVEQLKQESVKVREEVEKEREMLQVADVLREERVQMKLMEAKYQFEEKNAAVDKLRKELEAFLDTKEAKESHSGSRNFGGIIEAGGHLSNTVALYQNRQMGKGNGATQYGERCSDLDPEDDSTESELHSIELNMDNKNWKSMWNYATGTSLEDQKRPSLDRESKGRKSTSGKIARGRISLERCNSDGIEWDFSTENCKNWGDGYDQGTNSVTEKQSRGRYSELERQRSISIRDLREYIAANSRLAPVRDSSSPSKQWEP